MKRSVVVLSAGVLVLCSIVTRVGAQAPQSPAPRPPLPLRMTAWAVNMSNIATGANATVEINVTHWSTDAERTALITTFLEKGQDALLSALQKSTAHGRMRYPGVTGPDPQNMRLGYDLRYAWHVPLPEGGDRIVIALDRYIGLREAVAQPRISDYPFTFIEIHLPRGGGAGEGKMALATRLSFDKQKNVIELENYSSEPVRLQQIAVQK